MIKAKGKKFSIKDFYMLEKIFNILNSGKLEKFYSECKVMNNSFLDNSEKIQKVLSRWNRDLEIDKNPIMTKQDVIKLLHENSEKIKPYTYVYTSGSTGEPLKLPISKRRSLIKKASLLYYNGLCGYQFGNKYLFIRAKDRNPIIKKLRNEYLFIPKSLSNESIIYYLKLLSRKKINFIIGRPSVIAEMARVVLIGSNENFKIKGIICTSESLHEHDYNIIKEAFDCMILDRYGNEEVGVIAHQRESNGPLVVDNFSVYIEVLDPISLIPTKPGKIGRVYVTDLYSDIIPLIRYDTGDEGIVSKRVGGKVYSLEKIIGRSVDMLYSQDGEKISSLSLGPPIYKALSSNGYHCSYQFAQVGENSFELRLKHQQKKNIEDNLRNEIVLKLRAILGKDSIINIKSVEEIEQSKSGKIVIYKQEYFNKGR